METKNEIYYLSHSIHVLILPMRNGNIEPLIIAIGMLENGSYPTYEEWKRYVAGKIHVSMYRVLILPMRNGNIFFLIKILIRS